jgi:DNA-binding NarL/FixJ family response regulator
MKRLLLVDDHDVFRESLVLLLTHRIPGVAFLEAGSLAAAIAQLAPGSGIDMVLLDLELRDSHGLDTLAQVREAAPLTPVMVLSADDRHENVLAALDHGAAGFLPKTVDSRQLVAAIQTINGGVFVPPSVAVAQAHGSAVQRGFDDEAVALSERQRDVLRLLIAGQSNKQICRELDLSEATVKTHLQAVFRKLDVNTRTQAVVAAARLGLRLAP